MAELAAAGFASLLVAAFGIRTVVHWRRTGSSGWVPAATPAARLGDGLFTLGALGTLAAAGLDLFGVLEPFDAVDGMLAATLGAVLLGGGALVALTAQAQMGAAWRAGIEVAGRDQLVRHGLFAAVRNPFYLGMILASAGVTLLTPNGVAVTAWGLLVAGCEIDVRLVEEPCLRAAYGDAYLRYAASVGRFLPYVGRRRSQ